MLSRREFLGTVASAASGAFLTSAFGRELILRPRRAPAYAALFRTTEMIGRVTGQSAVVNLVTAEDLDAGVLARVRWAGSANALPGSPYVSPIFAGNEPLSRLELPITGLEPNQEYVYRVEFASAASPNDWLAMDHVASFVSQKTSGQSFSFSVVADGHWGQHGNVPPGGPRWWTGTQCLRHILADGPSDFMIDLGDAPFPAGNSPSRAVEMYVGYRDVMAQVARAMPVYLTLGNHECEAGFYQGRQGVYRQLWNTQARLLSIPNPRGDTYPEGGEGAPGYDSLGDWFGEAGPWNDGAPLSHLQNFYAWTWGDALFVVLDPYRCTLVGADTSPNSPSQYTLGPTQLQWLEDVLAGSSATWKFVICHHQVGGGLIGRGGNIIEEGGTEYAYGRGSAVEADRPDTEQAIIHGMMQQYGAQFFLYGHDHGFCHSVKDDIHYLCCGRTTFLNTWWQNAGMLDSYGSLLTQGQDKPWIEALYNLIGYTRFTVTPNRVTVQWIRTGYSFEQFPPWIKDAVRDWRESWAGREYLVDSPWSVTVTVPPKDVDAVRTVGGVQVPGFFEPPPGLDYQAEPGPMEPAYQPPESIPLDNFPESVAVVDAVPELVYEVNFEI